MAKKVLTALRSLLTQRGLDAYLVPRADHFFGEEVRPCDERLQAVSGFASSAGLGVVLAQGNSLLLLDSRYSGQAKAELAGQPWDVIEGGMREIQDRLAGLQIAYDPWLFSPGQFDGLKELTLVALPTNLVDAVWDDRPPPQAQASYDLPQSLTGEASLDKRRRLAAACKGRALLITQPDALAWLMNWRGSDLAYTPVRLAFGLLWTEGDIEVFASEDREGLCRALAKSPTPVPTPIQYDPASTSLALVEALGERGQPRPCPIRAAKAVKNAAEIAALRAAHVADGKAVTAFLHWFEQADKTQLTELDLADKLADCRAAVPGYAGPSFATISGAGPNGSLPHYRVSRASNRRLREGDFVVLDSGGQYPGATTDVTRTLRVGQVSAERRAHFTLVLKGMIALTLQQFPVGTTGHQLDVLARAALWNAGLNYAHGTGHGVGAGLSVHEAPPNLSPKNLSSRAQTAPSDWALKPGMVFSNEPGYYHPGAYGIRCENLMLVVEQAPGWLRLETLTKVPFDESLVVWELLTRAEADWLRAYQAQVL